MRNVNKGTGCRSGGPLIQNQINESKKEWKWWTLVGKGTGSRPRGVPSQVQTKEIYEMR